MARGPNPPLPSRLTANVRLEGRASCRSAGVEPRVGAGDGLATHRRIRRKGAPSYGSLAPASRWLPCSQVRGEGVSLGLTAGQGRRGCIEAVWWARWTDTRPGSLTRPSTRHDNARYVHSRQRRSKSMKVEYAFLCERVERVSDDTINAMGISIRRYAQPPQVPILFGDLWLVANLQADHKEVGDARVWGLGRGREGQPCEPTRIPGVRSFCVDWTRTHVRQRILRVEGRTTDAR